MKGRILNLIAAVTFFQASLPISLAADNISVFVDGVQVQFDVQPQLVNDRTMVPMRAIFEALGAVVEWDDYTQTASAHKNNKIINLTIGSPYMYVNGEAVSLDSPAYVINGRTLVPVRAISESLGLNVSWNDRTQTVNISSAPTFNSEMPIDFNKVLYENNIMDYAYLLPDDYDGDGREEAYVIGGLHTDDYRSPEDEYQELEYINVYFIDANGNFYDVDHLDGTGVYNGKVDVSNGKFITIEISYGGSGSKSKIYGCNNGTPFIPQISGTLGGFGMYEGRYVYYVNNFGTGRHEYIEKELAYNPATREFY